MSEGLFFLVKGFSKFARIRKEEHRGSPLHSPRARGGAQLPCCASLGGFSATSMWRSASGGLFLMQEFARIRKASREQARLPLCTPGVDSKRMAFLNLRRIRKGEHHGSPSALPPCPRRRPTSCCASLGGFFRHLHVAESIASGSLFCFNEWLFLFFLVKNLQEFARGSITAPPLHTPRARGDAQPPCCASLGGFSATSMWRSR